MPNTRKAALHEQYGVGKPSKFNDIDHLPPLSGFYAESGAMHWGTQDRDGRAHIAYFIQDIEMGFVWSGDPLENVEVTLGGYGEPCYFEFQFHHFDPDADMRSPHRRPVGHHLQMFRQACDAWLAKQPTLYRALVNKEI